MCIMTTSDDGKDHIHTLDNRIPRTALSSLKDTKEQISLNVNWDELYDIKYLTSGGSSNVYTATFLENSVIIKVLKSEFVEDETFLKEMESEISILSRLDHPNVVKLFGAGYNSKGHRFLILERLSGGTMDKIFEGNCKSYNFRKSNNKALPMKDILVNAHAIASAMRYFHSPINGCSILHRDLKPDNIGFACDRTLKIIDFGLATVVESSSLSCDDDVNDDLYEMTGGIGSLRYMAPEVADSRPYNHKADVYSFSILLWELLSCKKPYPGLGIDEFYDQIIYGGERPPIDPKWPKELVALMEKCWDVNIEKRPTSKAIVSALESIKNSAEGTNISATATCKRNVSRRRSMSNMVRKSNLSRLL